MPLDTGGINPLEFLEGLKIDDVKTFDRGSE
jgi:hypothetical protein